MSVTPAPQASVDGAPAPPMSTVVVPRGSATRFEVLKRELQKSYSQDPRIPANGNTPVTVSEDEPR